MESSEASLPVNYSYIIGLYLAVNAVPDLFVYVDGADCATFKAEFVYGRHDLNSTLLDCGGPDRIVRPPNVDVTSIVHDRTAQIKEQLQETCKIPAAGGVMYTSMPMATITGTQYDSIVRELGPLLSKPVFEAPSLSLSSDWIGGYAEALKSLASGMELEGEPDPSKVAVVGYMMDRTERDHTANVAQLEELLRGISLEPVSVWPSGRPLAHLAKAGNAGMVISLPHGREAAATIAERTGARLIETGIPFGLDGTVRWLREIAGALGLEERAEKYIGEQLRRALPGARWLVNRVFLGKRFFFSGDPHMMEPMRNFFHEFGCRPLSMVALAQEKHLTPLPKHLVEDGVPVLFNARPEEISSLTRETLEDECDFIIAGDLEWSFITPPHAHPCALVPFGFTSYHRHAVADSPYLGFGGALHFLNTVANGIMKELSDWKIKRG